MYIQKVLELHRLYIEGKPGGKMANLTGADLTGADLTGADLTWANLTGADLTRANLTRADLTGANLTRANLTRADLTWANLYRANLTHAYLTGANLNYANLSEVQGLPSQSDFIAKLEKDELGIIVYKRIGKTQYEVPSHWEIKEGSFLTEVVNPSRCTECACGVNVGTLEWCKRNYYTADLWKCRILWQDLSDVCVPFNTDGKFRAGRVELLNKVKL